MGERFDDVKSILVVEDDSTLRRVLQDNFESRGFEVDAISDGEVGLTHACRGSYDIIVLDVMLPGANGFEICQHVRERGIETPIVMLTAKGQEDDVVRGLIANEQMDFAIECVVDDADVECGGEIDDGGELVSVVLKGTIEDGEISGGADFGGWGSGDWYARRQ